MLTFENIIIIIISYLLGCIPFGLLIVKKYSGKDIRNEGSGNVGAMNSFDITGNKSAGIIVFALDALKGSTAVLFASMISGGLFQSIAIAAVWVVIGHNYNIFLKFKGGKGLSTATGALLLINPLTIILWGLMWASGYFIIKKDVNVGNITASIMAPMMLFSSPSELINLFNLTYIPLLIQLKVLALVVCIVILLKHRDAFKEFVSNKMVD